MNKKTLMQLTVGDPLYECIKGTDHFKVVSVYSVVEKELTLSNSRVSRIPRSIRTNSDYIQESYNSKYVYFANLSDALRYVKAQSLTVLRNLIKAADSAIAEVKKFREKHYEDLNTTWIENNIVQLEKALQ